MYRLVEMAHSNCFLCAPDPDLIVAFANSVFCMVGLGPLTDTYAMLVAREHTPSLADLARANPDAIGAIEKLRMELENVRGPLLMTEHGRVPVCRHDGDHHEAHCFHAHALLFSLKRSILDRARPYYGSFAQFADLTSALAYADDTDAYLLVSETGGDYAILSRPLNAPRQLARTLVSIESGTSELSDWRMQPRKDEAIARAHSLRVLLEPRS